MRISTRGRYGLRLLVDIVENGGNGPVALSTVAKRQNLSEKYLQQVALLLTRGGFLTSVKGSGGGYLLKDRAQQIRIYNVLDLLEGSISFQEEETERESPIERIIRLHFYAQLDQEIARVFADLTLADVCKADWFTYEI